jgi:hypothetical protein
MNLNEFFMDAFGTQTFSKRNMKAGFSFISGHGCPLLQVSPNIGDGHKMAPASLHCACIIALTAMVAGPTAQASGTTLTLACQGTLISQWGKAPKSSEVVNIGIIVDLQKKTGARGSTHNR